MSHFGAVTLPLLPFAMARAAFPCPALLHAAAAAPLGGAREALVATVVAVRLAAAGLNPGRLSPAQREARADAARVWGSALPLPPRLRTALQRVFAASTGADPGVTADALESLLETLAPAPPEAVRQEVRRLTERLRAAPTRLPTLDADR
ncbi:MAG: hypothetical protein RL139_212 [Gemmatimonadota bacterium]